MYASYKETLKKYRASLGPGSHDGSLGDDQPQPIAVEGDFDYDLIVIGGGSGGLAAAKEAGSADKKVACLDFVKPSPQGTTWSLGGTCVNVGCIPKKLMHQAANLGEGVEDASKYGWKFDSTRTHDWKGLVEAVQNYIHSQNWNCRVGLRSKHVTYINAYGQFVGDHKLKTTNKKGKESFITSRYFLLAMGGRPRYPATPGVKEYCISSDDLFSLPYCPGKTCVIGASYVGLECGGFLAALEMDVTIVVRSILLRGFDQEMAEVVGSYMEKHKNLTFRRPATVTKVEEIEKGEPGLYRVTIQMADGTEIVDTFNTVLVAVGRDPCTKNIGLDTVGVKLEEDGSVVHSSYERTTCPYIYAIGDVLAGKPQLTPVAIQAGKLLARRLFHGGLTKMDYHNIPTVVFTPLEYGCIGLSEADSIAKYGDADIEVYHTHYQPLEWTVAQRDPKTCYVKLICVLSQNRRAVGLHILGPNVGEIVQGFALALRLGATKDDFDLTVGIHPTCAEVITMLAITKRSGQDTSPGSC